MVVMWLGIKVSILVIMVMVLIKEVFPGIKERKGLCLSLGTREVKTAHYIQTNNLRDLVILIRAR